MSGSSVEREYKSAVGHEVDLQGDDAVLAARNADTDFIDSVMRTEVACISSAP